MIGYAHVIYIVDARTYDIKGVVISIMDTLMYTHMHIPTYRCCFLFIFAKY